MYKVEIENGYYLFKLKDVLKEKNISINKLMRDIVLARLCNYLNCDVKDIFEYKKENIKINN